MDGRGCHSEPKRRRGKSLSKKEKFSFRMYKGFIIANRDSSLHVVPLRMTLGVGQLLCHPETLAEQGSLDLVFRMGDAVLLRNEILRFASFRSHQVLTLLFGVRSGATQLRRGLNEFALDISQGSIQCRIALEVNFVWPQFEMMN